MAAEAAAFVGWLHDQRYTDFVVDLHVRRLTYVAPRLGGAPFTTHNAAAVTAAFGRERHPCGRRNGFAATARAYTRFLAQQGRLITLPPPPHVVLWERYERYLHDVRGLSASARCHHGITVRRLLTEGVPPGGTLQELGRDDVERFVERRGRAVSRHSLQHEVAQVRAFLRYAHDHGLVAQRLDAVDTPRTYRGELPPQALPWSTVTRLLASIDQRTALGRRDLCILHLIAYYGLRPCDVVGLRLDAIDEVQQVLRVVQRKTGSTLLLPLDARTVRLLRRYVARDRRGAAATDPLFLRARCPAGPIDRTAVSDLFRKRMREAGLPDCGKHVYRLRHTLAMRLLSRGVGIKAIGDVLGHRSFYGTSAYLRLDVAMLRGVALEVPAGAGGCHA
ncbi:MAG: tyrosine-type recombinase/integrase [Gammaproteobacteria bacterium]|nr:tyrosine-type recombinase/integrase [Gammaproteobacteria bacterium]